MLDFIYNPQRRRELENILRSRRASHAQRLFLVGFLHNVVGLSSSDVLDVIDKYNCWEDYNKELTQYQIEGTLKGIFVPVNGMQKKEHDVTSSKKCTDTSVFSKWNKSFFDDCSRTAYEYERDRLNRYGVMVWNPIRFPLYREIEGHDHILFVIDVDCNADSLDIGLSTAKHIYNIDRWEHFKFSGAKGFHMCRKEKNKTRRDLYDMAKEIYQSVKTNLISFTLDEDLKRDVNIDPVMYHRSRLIRGYSLHFGSNAYSIPIDSDMRVDTILDISKDINKVSDYLNQR